MPLPRLLLRTGRRGLAVCVAVCLAPRQGAAHAVVVGSEPAAGVTVPVLPQAVTVRFNSRIDHARSRLVLVAPDGVQAVLELTRDSEPTLLQGGVPAGLAAPPGAWWLRWQVLAIDGHITRGDVPFRLRPP